MIRKSTKQRNSTGKEPCDICKESHYLEIHHIHGRKIPNFNANWNLSNICGNCHNSVHRGAIIIEGWFMTSNGYELLWHTADEGSFTGTDAKPHRI